MKSKNKVYIILLTSIVVVFSFFFSTKCWLPDDRTKQRLNYDELVTVGDWNIHIGKAEYDKKRKTMQCLVYQKADTDSPEPYKISAYLGKLSLERHLQYVVEKQKNNPDYYFVLIKNIPSDYYYVTIELTTQESEENRTESNDSDPFAESETSSTTAITDTEAVRIDYRTAASVSYETSSI